MTPRAEPLPFEFAEPLALVADRLGCFAGNILWYSEVTSTNDVAAVLAEQRPGEGSVVLANAQSSGRGRQGRPWVSPAGAGLYVSIVLRPPPHAVTLVTIAAGVAVADGIQTATGLDVQLKWPNDVQIGGRKVAGLLAEASSSTAVPSVQHVILGVGINVMAAAYPPEIASRATSLEGELGRPVDRGLLLAECLSSLAARYESLRRGDIAPVVGAWRARAAATLGRSVRWEAAGHACEGIAENIDDAGALLVRTAAGQVRVISGEVRWT